MLSTVDSEVQDALVCAISTLVFARDVEKIAKLFGELQLLPPEIVNNPQEVEALGQALDKMFDDILIYSNSSQVKGDGSTQIPQLRFDKLLDSLTRLIPRFQFDLPPYFLNNARALSTLEGIARSLDPSFSVLQVVYPYALNRMLRNPSDSQVVDDTLQSLIRSPVTGRIVRSKVGKLLDDAALVTGYKRRKLVFDILKTRGGLRLARMIAQEGAMDYLFPNHLNRLRKF
jgi:aarF domain-containing kinase